MRYDAIELHKSELFKIIDASIPNKAQNIAIKALIDTSVNDLMNRIAHGWLEDLPAPSIIQQNLHGS